MTDVSTGFGRLDPRVQRWIWKQGWTELRDIQEMAIGPILAGDRDVLITSSTASGKTEGAFLPIASTVADGSGLQVLYISPLKALINDQERRLESLLGAIDMPVHRWHGDVDAGKKQKLLKDPSGALLITPESLEALFVRRGSAIPGMLKGLRYIVVDELHAFIGAERGRQLQSLLNRVELALRRRIPRVALSATIGDLDLACEFLRPGEASSVERVVSTAAGSAVHLQVRGYRVTPPKVSEEEQDVRGAAGEDVPLEEALTGDHFDIADHLYSTLRGGRHIVFANLRRDVEVFSNILGRRTERERVPNEFWPHHGSLDRSLREDAEAALRDGTKPATVIATTTLELGIDVGSVESIAQIGPPQSVASMRQRLGRSGRRGSPSVLRVYVQEEELSGTTPPQDQLRTRLVQSVAMVRLLVQKWYEPPAPEALHLSTLVQQVLSLIAQFGGVRADQAWRALCSAGPFRSVDSETFMHFLRALGAAGLIQQDHDGTLVLGAKGERLVNHYTFYTAFSTPEEYRLVAGERTLGTVPITYPLMEGMYLIFGGKRWRVLSVEEETRTVHLKAAAGGNPPAFGGGAAPVHDRVREEMLRVYFEADEPAFLSSTGKELLTEGRASFHRLGLATRSFLQCGSSVLVFPWAGDRVLNTLVVMFRRRGFDVSSEGVAIGMDKTTVEQVVAHVEEMADEERLSGAELAEAVANKATEKHHVFLDAPLLCLDYASSALDVPGAYRVLQRLAKGVAVGVE